MKIGILCYPTYGGSGIVATELGMLLANNGHEVHFMSSNMPARLNMTQPNIYFHKVNVEIYPLFKYQPYDIALSSTIYHVVKIYKLDIIHAHYAIPYAYAAYMAKQMLKDDGIETPLITTLHGTDITLVGQHPSYKKSVEFSINKSDFVTSVSESLMKDTYINFDIKKEIKVIHNFIDNGVFTSFNNCCRSHFAEDHEKIMIHVSNLRKVKRIEDVLEVFKKVQQEIPTRLIIIGEGPEMERVNNFMEKHPTLIPKIRLMGKVNELYQILAYADVFILPSQQESFGLAALEAMAAGVPVISSNAGGLPEVNKHSSTGFIADIGDVDSMVEYTKKLFLDPELLAQMKINAKENAMKFDISNILPLYEDLYKKAIIQQIT
ncbi:N-acetyl-alpha-D-glucosaminyl L-malate synthase BshA [Elizabethkingia argentiflava]|uniref:N-acetyl-alpha-D-glucosaminyl L-malate synthase BshA n=1 Tax=Elizabethkingia argenteiflava TaxID=2681556 RepID=A0A845PY07_9FLAO|nr:N-acetyl-alpha-D-glucosaminyl L-malate synthase BshA [Elizabethkingia argenteiflava]NAW50960.1 N-acetyl-alpha-D-glucosaminyl L-malate synthase BshA [Elizabethkingia argenteiflava]